MKSHSLALFMGQRGHSCPKEAFAGLLYVQQGYPWPLGPSLSLKDRQASLVTPRGAGSRRLMQSPVTAPKALWASSEAGGGPEGEHVQDSCRKAPSRHRQHRGTLSSL